MDELATRRRSLFSKAPFSSALLYSGDESGNPNPAFLYFAGFAIDGCYLLLKPGSATVLSHGMNLRMAKSLSPHPVKLLGKKRTEEIRKACGRGKVGFAANEISASRYFALRKNAKLKLTDATQRVEQLRGEKSPRELAALRLSAGLARSILDSLDPWEFPTELALASHLRAAPLSQCAHVSFEPIVATGKNSSFPHHIPTNAKLSGMVLVDFGVRKNGYCSDFTRCYFRKKGTKEEEAYLKCKAVFAQLLDSLDGCSTGRDVYESSISIMKKAGLPALPHAIGHGIGLEVHEYPHLWQKSKDELPEGTVLAIEPAAYFSNYGVRFEDMVVKTKGGWKIL